jgi:hypothetical protein
MPFVRRGAGAVWRASIPLPTRTNQPVIFCTLVDDRIRAIVKAERAACF